MVSTVSTEIDRIRALARSGQVSATAVALNELQRVEGATIEVLQLGAEVVALAGNHDGALEILRKLNLREPKNNRTLRLAGRSFEAKGDILSARRAFYEASLADPNDDFSLAHAANMFERTNEFATALTLAQRLERGRPTERQRFELQLMKSSCLLHLGQLDAAESVLKSIRAERQEDARVAMLEGRVQLGRGESDAAERLFRKALAVADDADKTSIQHLLDHIQGRVGRGLDQQIAASLFDRYASKFEKHLVSDLGYSAPAQIAKIVAAHFSDRSFAMLDLGCGTGLVAEALRDATGYYVGVDISEKMLDEAEKKKLYRQLHQVDVRDALRDTKPNSFDFVVAADVFIYLGKLDDIIPHALRILREGGLFCFTIELDTFNPESTGTASAGMRTSHGASSTQALMLSAGFQNVEIAPFIMRHEAGEPVHAALCSGTRGVGDEGVG
jgi:predicted TPR repeat methyltransferase